jgi:hypothetical protein
MHWNQFETIKAIQKYYINKMIENTEKSSKLPFYNAFPYRPSKETQKRLQESVKDIKFTTN